MNKKIKFTTSKKNTIGDLILKIQSKEKLTRDEKYFLKEMKNSSKDVSKNFENITSNLSKGIYRLSKSMKYRSKKSNRKLISSGWFINDNMSLDMVQSDIFNYFKNDIDNHFNKIKENINKEKYSILEEIILLYNNNKYHLPIISLYTLIDSYLLEIGLPLFSNEKKIDRKDIVRNLKISYPYLDIYLDNLLSIILDRKDRNKNKHSKNTDNVKNKNILLNRHAIIHGISSKFGTEKNFYKVLSLYIFLIDFKNRINKHI